MASLTLLTSQKNDLFKVVQNYGFAPSEFAWRTRRTGPISNLSITPELFHAPSGYWFNIDRWEKGFYVAFSPGSETEKEEGLAGDWNSVAIVARKWLGYIRRETEVPDLWEGLAGGNQLLQDATTEQPSDNLPFTQAELPKVRECLENIKAYVLKTHELSEAQIRIVGARFDYMEEAATRLGRKDWMGIVISGLLSIAITLAFSGDSTHDLFQFAGQAVRQVLGTMLYLAGPH